MRGFRASRAFQNLKSSRFGNGSNNPIKSQDSVFFNNQDQNQQQQLKQALPDWLRMPDVVGKAVLKFVKSAAKPKKQALATPRKVVVAKSKKIVRAASVAAGKRPASGKRKAA